MSVNVLQRIWAYETTLCVVAMAKATHRRLMSMPWEERWFCRIFALNLIQIVVGVALISAPFVERLTAQIFDPTAQNTAVNSIKIDSVDRRVTALEMQDLNARVLVLESFRDDVQFIRRSVYGLFMTFIGTLALNALVFVQVMRTRKEMGLKQR